MLTNAAMGITAGIRLRRLVTLTGAGRDSSALHAIIGSNALSTTVRDTLRT
jgi:hypothetical protein